MTGGQIKDGSLSGEAGRRVKSREKEMKQAYDPQNRIQAHILYAQGDNHCDKVKAFACAVLSAEGLG